MERRSDTRIIIEVDSLFILQNANATEREFEGVLEDISEGGLCIEADYKLYSKVLDNINEDDIIHFSIPDVYQLFGEEISDVITGKAKVLRKSMDGDRVIFGCKFISRDEDIEQYVQNRKTSIYMENLRKEVIE